MFTTVWTEEKVDYLIRHYSNTPNAKIVAVTGISERTIQRKARALGLTKDADYIVSSVKEIVEYLRGFSPVWRDLVSGKGDFIL